ncbi:hypothetical protein [Branchiibius sp. NY16-3462-2]|uniref:hypothetical protein n=1 Tax=Branchiibius sp. NY16-3462-2 TaxID=1807500 RepID=UPI0025C1E4F1|nr:hypothetical protein [Branchiibius sp. NY16-3462-2]
MNTRRAVLIGNIFADYMISMVGMATNAFWLASLGGAAFGTCLGLLTLDLTRDPG